MLRWLKSYLKRYPSIVRLFRNLRCKLTNVRNELRDVRDSHIMRSRKTWTTPYGFKLLGSSSIHHRAMQAGTFEPEETALVQQYLHDAEVFVDVGANIGFYTCIARSSGKQVIAVEPLRRNLDYLYVNLAANRWNDIEVYPVGLSDRPGLGVLYGASVTGASLIRWWAGASQVFQRMIPLSTLDILLGARFSGKKLVIKIDVEGAEYQVLLGTRKIISMSPRPTWLIEICLNEYHPAGLNPNYAATFEIFWKHGYEARTADRRNQVVLPADVQRWVNAGSCHSGVINYNFVPVTEDSIENMECHQQSV